MLNRTEPLLYGGLLFLGLLIFLGAGPLDLPYIRLYSLAYAVVILGTIVWKAVQGFPLTFYDILAASFGGFFGLGTASTQTELLLFSPHTFPALVLTLVGLGAAYIGFQSSAGSDETSAWLPVFLKRLEGIHERTLFGLLAVRIGSWAFAVSQGLIMSGTGGMMTEVGTLTSAILILSSTFKPVAILVGSVLMNSERWTVRWMARLLIGIEVCQAFLGGRREIGFFVVVIAFVGYLKAGRLRVSQLTWSTVAPLVVLLVVGPLFYHLRNVMIRYEVHSAPVEERLGLMLNEVLPETQETFKLSTMLEEEGSYRENLEKRGYILGPLAETISAVSSGADYLYGAVFVRACVLIVPRFVWPEKINYLALDDAQTEQFIQSHFLLPLEDVASTLIWNGYTEGGIVGILIYMGLFGVLLAFLQWRVVAARSTLLGAIIFGLLLTWTYRPEISIDNILGDMRVMLVFLCMDLWLGNWIENVTMRNDFQCWESAGDVPPSGCMHTA